MSNPGHQLEVFFISNKFEEISLKERQREGKKIYEYSIKNVTNAASAFLFYFIFLMVLYLRHLLSRRHLT